MKVLALNAGSNSLKFELVDQPAGGSNPFGKSLVAGSIDDIGKSNAAFSLLEGKQAAAKKPVAAQDHGAAAALVLEWIENGHARSQGVANLASIERIGHRIVHGGDQLTTTARITDSLLKKIDRWKPLAPFHTKSVQQVISTARSSVGGSIPMYAVFDTAFHQHLPDEAALYALPPQLAADDGSRGGRLRVTDSARRPLRKLMRH